MTSFVSGNTGSKMKQNGFIGTVNDDIEGGMIIGNNVRGNILTSPDREPVTQASFLLQTAAMTKTTGTTRTATTTSTASVRARLVSNLTKNKNKNIVGGQEDRDEESKEHEDDELGVNNNHKSYSDDGDVDRKVIAAERVRSRQLELLLLENARLRDENETLLSERVEHIDMLEDLSFLVRYLHTAAMGIDDDDNDDHYNNNAKYNTDNSNGTTTTKVLTPAQAMALTLKASKKKIEKLDNERQRLKDLCIAQSLRLQATGTDQNEEKKKKNDEEDAKIIAEDVDERAVELTIESFKNQIEELTRKNDSLVTKCEQHVIMIDTMKEQNDLQKAKIDILEDFASTYLKNHHHHPTKNIAYHSDDILLGGDYIGNIAKWGFSSWRNTTAPSSTTKDNRSATAIRKNDVEDLSGSFCTALTAEESEVSFESTNIDLLNGPATDNTIFMVGTQALDSSIRDSSINESRATSSVPLQEQQQQQQQPASSSPNDVVVTQEQLLQQHQAANKRMLFSTTKRMLGFTTN